MYQNKGADQLRGYRAKLICVFGFAYADCWFSHEAAHFLSHDSMGSNRMGWGGGGGGRNCSKLLAL